MVEALDLNPFQSLTKLDKKNLEKLQKQMFL